MLELFKWIKSKLPFIWTIVQWFNGALVNLFWGRKIDKATSQFLPYKDEQGLTYKLVDYSDLDSMVDLMSRQPEGFDEFFKPHAFDKKTFEKIYKNKAFLMMATFDGEKAVGYFFIRYFTIHKSFRGKMVDAAYQGRGIAKRMGILMTDIALGSGFRLFATISKKNVKSMASSKAVNEMKILKELEDGYYYIEYLPKKK